jgi:hypothetical protein
MARGAEPGLKETSKVAVRADGAPFVGSGVKTTATVQVAADARVDVQVFVSAGTLKSVAFPPDA